MSLGREPEDKGRRPSDPAMLSPAFSVRHSGHSLEAHSYPGHGDWGCRGGWDTSQVLLLLGPAAMSHQQLFIYNSSGRGKILWLSGKDWGLISNICPEREWGAVVTCQPSVTQGVLWRKPVSPARWECGSKAIVQHVRSVDPCQKINLNLDSTTLLLI